MGELPPEGLNLDGKGIRNQNYNVSATSVAAKAYRNSRVGGPMAKEEIKMNKQLL